MKTIKNEFNEIIVLASGFVVYWYADSDHLLPIWEHETVNPEEALKYFKMGKENERV